MKKRLINILILPLAILFIMPIFAMIYLSLSLNSTFSIQGYLDLFFDCFVFYPMFWNSVIYAGIITVTQILIIIPCAFGFANARFKGKGALFVFYIILMMMPLQVTILPNYIGLLDMGLINTPFAIIFPMVFSPFGVVVMRQYMKNIDNSIIECCRLETNSILRIMLTSIVPQIKTCIFAVVLFVYAEMWNLVEQPMLFLKENELKTLSVFISESQNYEGNILFPSSVIFMIPILLLYLLFNENLEKGLTFGEK